MKGIRVAVALLILAAPAAASASESSGREGATRVPQSFRQDRAARQRLSIDLDESRPVWKRNPNVIALEAGGRAGIYSLNFDHAFGATASLGIGYSYFGLRGGSGGAGVSIVPIYANLYFLEGNHRPYVTGGVSFVSVGAGADGAGLSALGGGTTAGIPTFGLGYEYRGDGGFLFRFTPYLLLSG